VLPDDSTGLSPGTRQLAGQKTVTVQGGYGTCFCRHGTNFIACWRDRGTSLIGATNISPITNFVAGTGAVSRYNLSRSQKFVKVQDKYCGQMSVSGCKNHYKIVLGAGAKVEERSDEIPPWRGKNRDKQLTHIGRVISRSFLLLSGNYQPVVLG
jgi:hypothetical protein